MRDINPRFTERLVWQSTDSDEAGSSRRPDAQPVCLCVGGALLLS